jgi:hypothetical protein
MSNIDNVWIVEGTKINKYTQSILVFDQKNKKMEEIIVKLPTNYIENGFTLHYVSFQKFVNENIFIKVMAKKFEEERKIQIVSLIMKFSKDGKLLAIIPIEKFENTITTTISSKGNIYQMCHNIWTNEGRIQGLKVIKWEKK